MRHRPGSSLRVLLPAARVSLAAPFCADRLTSPAVGHDTASGLLYRPGIRNRALRHRVALAVGNVRPRRRIAVGAHRGIYDSDLWPDCLAARPPAPRTVPFDRCSGVDRDRVFPLRTHAFQFRVDGRRVRSGRLSSALPHRRNRRIVWRHFFGRRLVRLRCHRQTSSSRRASNGPAGAFIRAVFPRPSRPRSGRLLPGTVGPGKFGGR